MNAFLEYLVKSSLALTVFYFFYWLFLRNDTHFVLNRIILIFSLLLSVFLPLINIHIFQSEPVIPILNLNFEPETASFANTQITSFVAGWNIWKIISVIYFTGAALILLRLIYQGIYLRALSRLARSEKHNDFTLVYMEKDIIPFSYFNKIFIPKTYLNDSGIKSIIDHEKSHLKQFHFIDLFLAESITIVQWFNPFAWLYEHSVKEIHEYLADRAVLNQGYVKGNYQALLVNQAMGGPVFTITNQFNKSLIKKRIIMMTKMKSPRLAQLKSFLLLPLISVLLMAFATRETIMPFPDKDSVISREEFSVSGSVTNSKNEPIQNAIVILKGSTVGVITDIEGNYKIIAGKNDVLVFSFVGYKSQEKRINSQSVINVQMEWDAFTIDFSKNSMIASKSPESETTTGKGNFVVVEELPSYPGGTDALKKFIYDNLQYPAEAKRVKMEGKVIINFIVNPEGKVTNAKVMRGTSPILDGEALRITNLISGWVPGKQNGHPVACRVIMPIEFKLQ